MYHEDPKYYGHDIRVHPSTFKYWCPDYDLQADTVDDLKAQIKAMQTEREHRPTVAVMFEPKYEDKLVKGTATGVPTRMGGSHIWVTYKRNGETKREQAYYGSVYLDTPENRQLLRDIEAKQKEVSRLEAEVSKMQDKLEIIKLTENED